ncbi:MAG: hypothetical protein IJC00_05120, partial [Clostridia bacterium]|nr:hypothetical protein [Clostridia bacterium]
VHLPELMDWMDRMYPEAKQNGSAVYALLKQACSDRANSLYRWLSSLFRDIDPQTLYHLSENYILHADWARHHAAASIDSRTVTCLVNEGPEAPGQRCDTILSFDTLDAVVTEERERGIHRFLIAGDEPLQHKRELVAVANKHSRCTFWVLTGGKLIDERFARDLLRTGNVIPLLTREKLDGTPAQASEILHTFRVLFGMLVSGSEPAADQDRAIEQGAKEVLLITDPYALGYGTPPQDRTIGQSMGDTPDLTLPVRLWRLKRENGRDARWMLDDARHLVIDSLGIAGIVNDSGEDSGFAHILRLREVAPA